VTDEPPSSTPARWAVIVTGGEPLIAGAAAHVPPHAFLIAADSGLDHALGAGLRPDLLVGDLDSVSTAGVAWAREHRIPIEVHPTDKDVTDTQIALAAATHRQYDHVLLLSGGGDRLDHSIGAITALGHPSLGDCRTVTAIWGTSRIHVFHAPGYWEVPVADSATFSLLALHGECDRIALTGARWPLADATLEPASTRGISNVATQALLRLTVGSGVLTLVIPDAVTATTSPRSEPGAPS
jgi:thiamine pyrophosphokinase